ncbi:MAG: hypothetical protein H0U82_12405 [Actinobacteria bacterium]|nr:hypothetical protein [Actinomycetota bacterium]
MSAQAGGFLAQPPGLDGEPGLGIPGISGVPRRRTWDVVASAHAPELTGDSVLFVALEDGELVVEEDVPDDSIGPLADAIEASLSPPYRAAAMRKDGDLWTAIAERVLIVNLLDLEGDSVDLTVVDGVRELRIDEKPTIQPLAGLDALTEEHGDVALHAERVDGDVFAVDVFPL